MLGDDSDEKRARRPPPRPHVAVRCRVRVPAVKLGLFLLTLIYCGRTRVLDVSYVDSAIGMGPMVAVSPRFKTLNIHLTLG